MNSEDIKNKTVRGIKWTGISSMSLALIQIVGTLLLAYYLSKNEMGEIAIIQTVVGIIMIFLDMGVSNAIIYKKEITDEQLSGVFWINMSSGTVFTLLGIGLSGVIGWFYNSEMLPHYIAWISVSFIILGVSRFFKFLFIKELKLKEVSLSEIYSYGLSFAFMAVLLYNGYRVHAFVYAIIIRSIIQTLYLLYKGLKIFVPGLVFNRKSLKDIYRYGMFNLAEMLTDYLNSQWDTILFGRLLGLEVLGVYNVAKTLAFKPMQLMTPLVYKVNFPLMSKVQDRPEELKKYYLLSVKYLFAALVVIYMTLIIEAEDLLRFLYGIKWLKAVPYLQLLSIYFMVRTVRNPLGSLVLASGKVHWRFYWNLVLVVVLPLLIYFTSPFGLPAVVTGLILWYALALYISFRLITRKIIPVRFPELLHPVFKSVLMMIPSVLIAYALHTLIGNVVMRLLMVSSVSLAVYLLVVRKWDPELFAELTHLFKKSKNAA